MAFRDFYLQSCRSVRLGRIVKGRRKIRPNDKKGRILKGITGQKAEKYYDLK